MCVLVFVDKAFDWLYVRYKYGAEIKLWGYVRHM